MGSKNLHDFLKVSHKDIVKAINRDGKDIDGRFYYVKASDMSDKV